MKRRRERCTHIREAGATKDLPFSNQPRSELKLNLGYLNVFEVRWLCFVRKQKGGQNYSGRIIVWNQDDKIIRGRNNRGTRKTLVLLWENHFTRYYLRENIGDWLYGENSDWFWAVGNLSQCLKKDICNVWEISEDAAMLSLYVIKR